jgi:hypothetical protein
MLYSVARAQLDIGDISGAKETARSLELLEKCPTAKPNERALLWAELGYIHGRICGPTAAQRAFVKARALINRHQLPKLQSDIAIVRAETGDFKGAVETVKLMYTKDRPEEEKALNESFAVQAFYKIGLLQLNYRDFAGAERVALLIDKGRDGRDLLLIGVVKGYSDKGLFEKARGSALRIANRGRKIQAILELCERLAKRGQKRKAQHTARECVDFDLGKPDTWALSYYERYPIGLRSIIKGHQIGADVIGAAIRCKLSINPNSYIPYDKLTDFWTARQIAAARGVAKNPACVMSWVKRLSPESRVRAVIGLAESLKSGDRAKRQGTGRDAR